MARDSLSSLLEDMGENKHLNGILDTVRTLTKTHIFGREDSSFHLVVFNAGSKTSPLPLLVGETSPEDPEEVELINGDNYTQAKVSPFAAGVAVSMLAYRAYSYTLNANQVSMHVFLDTLFFDLRDWLDSVDESILSKRDVLAIYAFLD